MAGHVLSKAEAETLHGWLAEGSHYPQIVQRMLAQFGKVITAPACTWHRHHHAARIAELRNKQVKQAERRDRDRQAKAARRANTTIPPSM